VPVTAAIPSDEVELMLKKALEAAETLGVKGKEITPFLLSEMSMISEGKTLAANIALLENNVRVAVEVCKRIES
jgi:pseudouridine-5'-phosphate glycosidase